MDSLGIHLRHNVESRNEFRPGDHKKGKAECVSAQVKSTAECYPVVRKHCVTQRSLNHLEFAKGYFDWSVPGNDDGACKWRSYPWGDAQCSARCIFAHNPEGLGAAVLFGAAVFSGTGVVVGASGLFPATTTRSTAHSPHPAKGLLRLMVDLTA